MRKRLKNRIIHSICLAHLCSSYITRTVLYFSLSYKVSLNVCLALLHDMYTFVLGVSARQNSRFSSLLDLDHLINI